MRSETFGRLLKAAIGSIVAHEGKTAPVVEEELGNLLGVSGASIQRYKAGHIPPETNSIAVLARASVQRGYLNRAWLKTFLQTTRYPDSEGLLTELYGGSQFSLVAPGGNRQVYSNLPAPTYSRFIQREVAYNDILEGLSQRCAAVVLVSLGGMGKTSLAREVAAACLGPTADPSFRAVVWVSDYGRPGTTTLETVLNEIALTLDYPGLVQLDSPARQREVELLLRRQAVLLVLDNCETITDSNLLEWIVRLPEPSKALLTSREYRPQFRRNCWLVDLAGLSSGEAHEFLKARIRALKLGSLVTEIRNLDVLVAVTGGNPKALDLALGYLKFSGETLDQVIHLLQSAQGEIFDDLFEGCWQMLEDDAQSVLLCMSLFAGSIALAALAGVAGISVTDCARVMSQLRELALVETQQNDLDTPPRYTLHPLVAAFISARLLSRPTFAQEARQRQLEWYNQLAAKVGYCWDNLARLSLLDPEQETIQALIQWCLDQHEDRWLFLLTRNVDYYYYIRGLWTTQPGISEVRLLAAQRQHDSEETMKALAYHIQMLCRQSRLEEAQKYLGQFTDLVEGQNLPVARRFDLEYTLGLYLTSREEYNSAIAVWQKALTLSENLSLRDYCVSRGWLALCFYRSGQKIEANRLWLAILEDATQGGFTRGIVSSQVGLARLYLDQVEYDRAMECLSSARNIASGYQDRGAIAEIEFLYALYYLKRADKKLAAQYGFQALDIFKRLGMYKEYAEATSLLSEAGII